MIMKVNIIGSSYTNSRKVKDFIFNLKEQFGDKLEIVSGGQKLGGDGYGKKLTEFEVNIVSSHQHITNTIFIV